MIGAAECFSHGPGLQVLFKDSGIPSGHQATLWRPVSQRRTHEDHRHPHHLHSSYSDHHWIVPSCFKYWREGENNRVNYTQRIAIAWYTTKLAVQEKHEPSGDTDTHFLLATSPRLSEVFGSQVIIILDFCLLLFSLSLCFM